MLAMLCIWFHVEAARVFLGGGLWSSKNRSHSAAIFCVLVLHVHFFFIIFSLILPKFFAAVLPNVLFFLTQ